MNFKRFNGSTWDAIHHKTYDTMTESLTTFPAMIQASGDPLTDYTVSGNTEQNGTPSPDAPVEVVGCGVWDEAHQSYKLPLTVNGTEHPIYLGQVETTRLVKKLVLTGEEGWTQSRAASNTFYTTVSGYLRQRGVIITICSHYPSQANINGASEIQDGNVAFYANVGQPFEYFYIRDSNLATLADFKSYLAAQYAAGTPVTVWYVLEEPETGIVNEPLMKIGDYADTITMAQAEVAIPTSDGDNTISFGTTVQPSAMSATFKGWHPVQGVKQYDGSEWR